jgi:hypothetical protein
MKSKPCEPSILVPVILGIHGLTGAAFLIGVQLEGRGGGERARIWLEASAALGGVTQAHRLSPWWQVYAIDSAQLCRRRAARDCLRGCERRANVPRAATTCHFQRHHVVEEGPTRAKARAEGAPVTGS